MSANRQTDGFDGVAEVSGEDGEAAAARDIVTAQVGGGDDPLAGLPDRIAKAGHDGPAFAEDVIDRLARLQRVSASTWREKRALLKTAGVSMRALEDAVKKRADALAAEEAESARRRVADAEKRAAEMRVAASEERLRELRGDDDGDERAAHFAEVVRNGMMIRVTPGLTEMEIPGKRGPETVTLAPCSIVILHDVEMVTSPDAVPHRWRVLSLMCGPDETPRRIEIPAKGWSRGEWLDEAIPARARVPTDRKLRTAFLDAIAACSTSTEVRRYGYTGLAAINGQTVYLHARGALGADGAVEGVDVRPPAPADRIALPEPPEGEALARAIAAAIAFFDVEPADVAVTLTGAIYRAPLGSSRLTVHVTGQKGTGKSLVAGLAQKHFGAATCSQDCTDGFGAQWTDSSSALGVARVCATTGDAVQVVDDYRLNGGRGDDATLALFDRVTRMHFNRSSPRKLTREGGARSDPPTRCTIISTGEVLPATASCVDRVIPCHLDVRPAPNAAAAQRAAELRASGRHDEARAASNLQGLVALANDGTLAAAMSAYIRWMIPRTEDIRANIGRHERAAAARWGLGDTDRAAALFGAVALGLEQFFAFVRDARALPERDIVKRETRAREALRRVALARAIVVTDEDPAVILCRAVGEALSTGGHAHITYVAPTGKHLPPRAHQRELGWIIDEHSAERDRWVPGAKTCIGRVSDSDRGMVLLDPGPFFLVASEYARRKGRAVNIDERALGPALKAAGLLAETDSARGTIAVWRRAGSGGTTTRRSFYAVRLSAIGIFEDGESAPNAASDTSGDVRQLAPDEEF